MDKGISRALVMLGLLLAVGMSTAALIMGLQVRHIGSGKQSITVKGLAEKPVKADRAEWSIRFDVTGKSLPETLKNLRETRPALDSFLKAQGFSADEISSSGENIGPNMVTEENAAGQMRSVQRGYAGSQALIVKSRALDKMQAAAAAIPDLLSSGLPISADDPNYLVSQLEEIKMSLIADATKNAQLRANEFASTGGVRLGNMRSASQGAFYILAPGASVDSAEYGGTYDKRSIDKMARVVVTIEYNIEN
ncbi:MAG: SIMPL domain-containing protein [Azonexus sp.]